MAQIIFSSFVHFGLLNTIYEALQSITYNSLVMHNSFLYMIGISHMWNHYQLLYASNPRPLWHNFVPIWI